MILRVRAVGASHQVRTPLKCLMCGVGQPDRETLETGVGQNNDIAGQGTVGVILCALRASIADSKWYFLLSSEFITLSY